MGMARNAVKRAIGEVAERALPTLAREIDEARNAGRAPKLKRAILYARLRRAHARGDNAAMNDALAAYWKGGPGNQFHATFADDRFRVFLDKHAVIFDALDEAVGQSGARYSRLVEIGCGDGRVLAYAAQRLPAIDRLIGLDINATVIGQASVEYRDNPRLSFEAADVRLWLAAHPQPGTVLLSNGGVLEYLAPDNVDALFATLAAASPAAVVLVEPAAPDHNLDRQTESYAFGRECSFSHNYRHRLSKAGFDVVFEREAPAFGARLILMIGVLVR